MIKDYLRMVYSNLHSRRLRSFLTLVGIVIGVVAIILLYTTGQGLEDVAGKQFDKFGARKILIGPKSINMFGSGPQASQGLTTDDAEFIRSLSDVDVLEYAFRMNAEIQVKDQTILASVAAVSTDTIEQSFFDSGLDPLEGRLLQNGDQQKVAVLGYTVAKDKFAKDLYAGQKIKINDVEYKIIGVVKKTGSQQDDLAVWGPYESLKDVFNITNEVTGIVVTVKKGVDLDTAANNIREKLKRKRNADDFTVINPVQLQQQTKDVLGVVKLVIVAIGLISLFVGGIGIMNSMYTAVLERTKEIGTMKAIGAKNSDILYLFVLESCIMGLLGGVIATIISLLGIFILQNIFAAVSVVPIQISIYPSVFIFSILFAVITGMVSGLWPAMKAAKLKPVDALRYE